MSAAGAKGRRKGDALVTEADEEGLVLVLSVSGVLEEANGRLRDLGLDVILLTPDNPLPLHTLACRRVVDLLVNWFAVVARWLTGMPVRVVSP